MYLLPELIIDKYFVLGKPNFIQVEYVLILYSYYGLL